MQSFKSFLNEARRNPEQNPKISIIDQLRPYKNSFDYFISYRNDLKMGINPQPLYSGQYDTKTPNAIYGYNIRNMWPAIELGLSDSERNIPYGLNKQYVFLFKIDPKDKIFIKDVRNDYNKDDLKVDIKKLKKMVSDRTLFTSVYSKTSKKYNIAFQILWETLRQYITLSPTDSVTMWNKYLRNLGYAAFADNGDGVIHRAEKSQVVVLSTEYIKVIDVFLNKFYTGKR